jgi:hypothetical protein
LTVLGFNGPQRAAAIGTLIERMTAPGSELATHHWLQQRSALGGCPRTQSTHNM